ncbi:MAG: tRNA modification GTPase [Gammaproteobacteria bacterium]|jgi:tRNA modification GTPase
MPKNSDTITAIATPTGRGGIGVVRVSGTKTKDIFKAITGLFPKARLVQFVSFKSSDQKTIDKGIALYFEAPASYTGEDVMECHAHGSRIVLGMLLDEILSLGARLALPGEFTERAFLNDKIDLLQAEAVADLIDSNSKKAARSAMQSLTGVFSDSVKDLRERVFNAKALIEAALDFPEEEDVVVDTQPASREVKVCMEMLNGLIVKAEAGRVLDQNPSIVIAGLPNAGKSSVLNYLSGFDSAIVSTTPGTTRDVIKEKVLLGDYAVTLFDTAGIRDTEDKVERDGVDRAHKALALADIVLCVHDNTLDDTSISGELIKHISSGAKIILVRNKIDLCSGKDFINSENEVFVSVKANVGMDQLVQTVCRHLEIVENEEDLIFSRQRHIDDLHRISKSLKSVLSDIASGAGLEVQAEALRQCLTGFDELTGETTSDDVLGAVFSKFCIGK